MVMYTSCDTRFVNGEEKELTPLRFLKEDAPMSQIVNKRKNAQKQSTVNDKPKTPTQRDYENQPDIVSNKQIPSSNAPLRRQFSSF